MPIEQARPSPPFETKNRSKVFNGEIQTNQIKSKIKPKQIKSNKPGLLLHLRQKILRLLKGLQRLTVKVKQNDKTRSLDPKSTESPRRGKSASRLNLTRSNFKERAAQKTIIINIEKQTEFEFPKVDSKRMRRPRGEARGHWETPSTHCVGFHPRL